MKDDLARLQSDALAAISTAAHEAALDEVRVAYLGKKGSITAISSGMKELSKEDKPAMGQALNAARNAITAAIDDRRQALQNELDAKSIEGLDVTLPPRTLPIGNCGR